MAPSSPGGDLYGVLKTAAEIFLLLHCGICPPTLVDPKVTQRRGEAQERRDRARGLRDLGPGNEQAAQQLEAEAEMLEREADALEGRARDSDPLEDIVFGSGTSTPADLDALEAELTRFLGESRYS